MKRREGVVKRREGVGKRGEREGWGREGEEGGVGSRRRERRGVDQGSQNGGKGKNILKCIII